MAFRGAAWHCTFHEVDADLLDRLRVRTRVEAVQDVEQLTRPNLGLPHGDAFAGVGQTQMGYRAHRRHSVARPAAPRGDASGTQT